MKRKFGEKIPAPRNGTTEVCNLIIEMANSEWREGEMEMRTNMNDGGEKLFAYI